MKILDKILVATDFSSPADDAVKMATFVARRFDSEIILLHVIEGQMDLSPDLVSMIRKEASDRLQEIAGRVRADGIKNVRTLVDEGVPFEQIDRCANEHNVNITVMGAGRLDAERWCGLGTEAARVRRKAIGPVWIVKPGAAPEINRVLCPVDCSKPSGRALKNAIHLSRRLRARLTVLSVVQSPWYHYERLKPTGTKTQEADIRDRLCQLDLFLADFDFHDVCWDKQVRSGDPAQEIVTVAREGEVDLLVMGSVGRTGLSRIVMGGVARKVAQRMPCSIVTVRGEDTIRLQLDAEIVDIESHYKQGHELLQNGFPVEAVLEFERCLAKNTMNPPAWEGLAAAHERLGHKEESRRCEERAKQIRQTIENARIEADIRSRHPLLGRRGPLF